MGYAAVDVHYPPDGGARAALVVTTAPDLATVTDERVVDLPSVAPYRPGAFYERELPALRAVLALAGRPQLLVVDGYVDLDPAGRPGLGAHVYAEGLAAVVVGVAKTLFHTATHAVPVLRGTATRPLYVTAAGMPVAQAAALVAAAAGAARLPDLLRRVDRLARSGDRRG